MDVPTIPARRIVIKNKSTAWFGTRYTMNIYRGCSHGCIYCDSRSECYGVQDFDTVRVKSDALAVIRNDLRSKTQSGVVATGSMSDPYNPFEKELQLTRHALELLDAYGFGAAVATKGTLITRDADILREIASHSPVLCKITVTTCDDALAAKLEPRAPSSSARLAAVEKLAGQGIFTGVLLMPVLPFLEDTPDGVRRLVRAAYNAGARFVYPAFGVTLRQNQRAYFLDRLDELFPGAGLRARYVRQFGTQYECRSPRARELWQAFTGECRAKGLLYGMQDIVAAYRQGYGSGQLSFL
ncbi:MAG: radical SAM protein [Ruthenibacterium lactatiformans]|uniref:SPL family radical SAM protein n=1 Tax=Ruthenibacterium lactatiformans TaxID=1550024 RepID=UPI003993C486